MIRKTLDATRGSRDAPMQIVNSTVKRGEIQRLDQVEGRG